MKTYPTNLSKSERQLITPHLPKRGNKHRRQWKWKTILNALFYILRTGCPWRYLPETFPPWQTIYGYHRRFCATRVWERLNIELRVCLRLHAGHNGQPSAVVIDTQSVKTTTSGGLRGFDGYKMINGRKRFLLVDTLGLLLLVKVLPANMVEQKTAMIGLEGANQVFNRVELVWADQGFGGAPFRRWVEAVLGWKLELTAGISKPGQADFRVAPRRWVVERTIAWLTRNRRLLCDFERVVEVSVGWVYAAMVLLMVRRLARSA